jgi:hypothetical protein
MDQYKPPVSFPASEFTTPKEMDTERVSQALGWDTSRPGLHAARQLFQFLPMVFPGRSTAGARIGNESVWAARTPSAIMWPETGASLARRYPSAFRDRRTASVRPIDEPANDATRAQAHERAYDAAAAAQAQHRNRMNWEASTAWRDDLSRLGFHFPDEALPGLAQARAQWRADAPDYPVLTDFADPVRSFVSAHGAAPWHFNPATGRRLGFFDAVSIDAPNHPFWSARQKWENTPPRRADGGSVDLLRRYAPGGLVSAGPAPQPPDPSRSMWLDNATGAPGASNERPLIYPESPLTPKVNYDAELGGQSYSPDDLAGMMGYRDRGVQTELGDKVPPSTPPSRIDQLRAWLFPLLSPNKAGR